MSFDSLDDQFDKNFRRSLETQIQILNFGQGGVPLNGKGLLLMKYSKLKGEILDLMIFIFP